MATSIQWRKFGFFDKEVIHENISQLLGSKVTCAVADSGNILLGDDSGVVYSYDRKLTMSWKHKLFRGAVKGIAYCYENGNHRKQFVVAIGDEYQRAFSDQKANLVGEPGAPQYVIKIYCTADMNRPIQAFHASTNCPPGASLTAFTVLPDCTKIAVGFSSGTVLLFSGLFLSQSANSNKQQTSVVLISRDNSPVAGLHFCELPNALTTATAKSSDKQVRLFVVMDTEAVPEPDPLSPPSASAPPSSAVGGVSVFSLPAVMSAASSAIRIAPLVLDDRGARAGCSAVVPDTCELVVARMEGLFSFSVEDRGGAAGIEGEKDHMGAVGRYILVSGPEDRTQQKAVLTAYDLRNKLIGHSHPLAVGERVLAILRDGDTSFVLTTLGAVHLLREKSTAAKIELLLKKAMFPLALTIAAEEQTDPTELMKLYKQYGDHLYKKGDFAGAMAQYKLTVGVLMSSYVIRRYLDVQRVGELSQYLEALSDKGVANEEHILLLLGCYTKTGDVAKLSVFAREEERRRQQSQSPRFRLALALDDLLETGYRDLALRLAVAHGDHNSYLQIQLGQEPLDPDAALTYFTALVGQLPMSQLEELLRSHGGTLLRQRAAVFTALLVRLCLGLSPPELQGAPVRLTETLGLTVVMGLFEELDGGEKGVSLRSFLDQLLTLGGGAALSTAGANTLIELHLAHYSEAVAGRLACPEGADEQETRELDDRVERVSAYVLGLLDNGTLRFDPHLALVNCVIFGFPAGEVQLLERQLQSSDLLLRKAMSSETDDALFSVLQKYGDSEPELFVQALLHLLAKDKDRQRQARAALGKGAKSSSSVGASGEDPTRWRAVLTLLEMLADRWQATTSPHCQFPAPIQVLNILASHSDIPVRISGGFIKKFVLGVVGEAEELDRNVASLRSTVSVLRGLEKDRRGREEDEREADLGESPSDQARSATSAPRQQHKWISIRKAQAEKAADQETFFAELENSSDGFATVASFFGKVLVT